MDPLPYFKEVLEKKREPLEVTHEGRRYLVFGDYAFQNDLLTQLAIYNRPNEYYTVEAVWFLWKHSHMTHTNYVKEAANKNVKAVTRIDRKEMLEYLGGERAEIPSNHDPHVPPPVPIPFSRIQTDSGEPISKKPKLDISVDKSLGQRADSTTSRDDGQDASQIRSLNEQLTVDKIAALKKKRMSHQKKNLVSLLDEEMMEVSSSEPTVSKNTTVRERVWRTRYNCMEATVKDFTNVLEILKSIKSREENANKQRNAGGDVSAPQKSAIKPKREAGYSRYDQEAFNPDANPEFATTMSFVGAGVKAGAGGFQLPDKTSTPMIRPNDAAKSTPGSNARSNSTPASGNGDQPRKRTNRTPIIVVPSTSALITMLNVKDILQNMSFVSADEKKAAGGRRETEVQLHRKRGDVTVPFRVVDNPVKLTDEEWGRVVAVFVMGPAWQFKGWKWNGNPVEIFTNVAAFHLYYDDLKPDPNVAKWNVTQIPISRTKRHLDKARLVKFWEVLDRHIAKNKGHLRF